jgi:23S rRNA (adenine2503-C2)-methyltransferase
VKPETLDDLWQALAAVSAGPRHAERVMRLWSQALPQTHGKRPLEAFLPATLRAALPAFEARLSAIAQLRLAHPGADGGERLLVDLADGQTVESVLLPRDGLCISSQVGCAVGCRFCMTGRDGLLRQLTDAEMVAQVALGRQRRPVRKVVFMGMGEPAHNLDAVQSAIELLGTHGNIAHKQLVFSTVGDPRVFERLPRGRVRPALALSLHSTFAARRRELLPRAPQMTPAELVEAADAYARETDYPVQYQWTLLDGVNDGDDEIEGLVALLAGRRGVLNLIPFNAVQGSGYRRPPHERCVAITRELNHRHIYTRLRQSAAQDVDGGCGQLRARAPDTPQTVIFERNRPPAPVSAG